jgi:two-component system CheB/CheR fusion protein
MQEPTSPPLASGVKDLVIVGASAGGIDALSRLVATLPAGFPAPLVLVQHLDPERISQLGEILAQRSSLPIRTVTDHERLEDGVVYVVPANRDVELTDHALSLLADRPGRPKPSIDLLLASGAAIFGERLVAVILTGTGSDGAEGARRVKEAGGTVIIQNPETARFPGLPLSLSAATVDIVADLDAIGPLIHDLVRGTYTAPSADEDRRMRDLLQQVRERSGIDFGYYRQPTIRRRLQRRMADVGAASVNDYTAYLERHPDEYRRLTRSFLIKVTDFFRDAELFEALRERVLPELLREARARGNELRLWSAGCATGEEAYSLAILVAELLGPQNEDLMVRVFATDVDADAIAYARRGIYPAAALESVPADLRARYFAHTDGNVEVRRLVRRMVVFAPHDLAQRPPFPRIDLTLCRNVLIYFTPELQRRALQLFAFSLRPGGRLVLGKSETTSPLPAFFAPEDPRLKIYVRRNEGVAIPISDIRETAPPEMLRLARQEVAETGLGRSAPTRAQAPRTQSEATERLLLDLPIGIVLVDRRFDVQAINGAARRLLSIHSTAIGEDLIHLARRAPAERLRSLLDRAFAGRPAIDRIEVRPLDAPAGMERVLEIQAYPQESNGEPGSTARAILMIADVTPAAEDQIAPESIIAPEQETILRARDRIADALTQAAPAAELGDVLAEAGAALDAALAALDRLTARIADAEQAKRELLDANETLTATNAELRGHNEELLLANEETQAAMEEVETLSEEQQASNEELETLNEELQATVEELNTTNDDLEARGLELQEAAALLESERSRLEATLASLGDGVLVVDRTGRPVRTNAAFDRMFPDAGVDLVPEDERGRPLPRHEWPQRRSAAGETFTMQFTRSSDDGARRRYEVSARPIEQDGQDGGVMVIRDVTDRAPGAARQSSS